MSKLPGDFYCHNYFQFFATKNKRESHKKVCKSNNFFNAVKSSEDTKIL